MLKKMVDGKELICSEEEERLIRKQWDLNKKYPEYSGHLQFDGINEPVHDIEACINHHRGLVRDIIEQKVKSINQDIEKAEENGDEASKISMISRRKYLKSHLPNDWSNFQDISLLKEHLEKIKVL